jgi:tRNA (guanine-N7-)-methyltransferase
MTDTLPPKTNGAPAHVAHPQTIRSFVRRAGRTTTGQTKALTELGPQYLVPFAQQALDYDTLFGRQAPVIFEIGFGMGETTARIAATRPEDNFLACEVHEPGVGALLKRMGEDQLSNIRIVSHDAVEVLAHMIPPLSLNGVHIYFPDPWHKKKHNKRRLIQADFVQNLCHHIAPGGYLHCATDWQPYAEQILEVLSAQALLANTSTHTHGYADKPAYRPLTKFENRGIKLGHGVWDLVFTKRA